MIRGKAICESLIRDCPNQLGRRIEMSAAPLSSEPLARKWGNSRDDVMLLAGIYIFIRTMGRPGPRQTPGVRATVLGSHREVEPVTVSSTGGPNISDST
jgi:hypothetical protein